MDISYFVMPHRILINGSLRRASSNTKNKIDAYNIEFERKIKKCEAELKQAEEGVQKSLAEVKNNLEEELKKDRLELEDIANEIVAYINTYFERTRLYTVRKLNSNKINIIEEKRQFVSEQVRLISEEVEILKKRQAELSTMCKVDDFIQLALYSGHELDLDIDDDVDKLLSKVSEAIKELNDESIIEKKALLKLRDIIQERSEYLSSVQYISWVIRQKIQYRKQLLSEKEEAQKNRQQLISENSAMNEEIARISEELGKKAKRIRYYWVKPLVYIKAEKSYFYSKLAKIKSVKAELSELSESRSNDQDRWARLQNELESAKADIEKNVRAKSKEDWDPLIKPWSDMRSFVFELCKKYEAPLMSPKQEIDENNLIQERLDEIQQIKEEGLAAAERQYKYEYEAIEAEFDRKLSDLTADISALNQLLHKKNEDIISYRKKIQVSEQDIKLCRKADSRFFLAKLISEDSDVSKVKAYKASLQRSLADAITSKDAMSSQLISLEADKTKSTEEKEIALKKCRKVVLRPTSEELLEEYMLELLQTDIKNRSTGKKNESKI